MAEQGHAEAAYILSHALRVWEGVTKDPVEADRWLRNAAELGFSNAQHALGIDYYKARDRAEAARWFRLAAKQGHPQASLNLAHALRGGGGMTKDNVEAARCFRLAAGQDDDEEVRTNAQFALALMLHLGQGVSQDQSEALRLAILAADQGHKDAQQFVERWASEFRSGSNPEHAPHRLVEAERAFQQAVKRQERAPEARGCVADGALRGSPRALRSRAAPDRPPLPPRPPLRHDAERRVGGPVVPPRGDREDGRSAGRARGVLRNGSGPCPERRGGGSLVRIRGDGGTPRCRGAIRGRRLLPPRRARQAERPQGGCPLFPLRGRAGAHGGAACDRRPSLMGQYV
ncbi:hypothetical protein T492DRAFT_974227 [Pavlovales sp. CCMP2436]|nr:hypothetical protein T492DRAFT_974227 [Pavlovales sp. CCMP2436]